MKLYLTILISIFQLVSFSQEDANWRLFPGGTNNNEKLSKQVETDSTIKSLNFDKELGKVTVFQPTSIDSLTSKHKRSSYILGYTVQLEVSQQTSKIRDARYRLLKLEPNAPIEEIYSAPNTYLYGGAFYTRTDAYEFKNAIKSYFPNAIVISKKLALPPIQTKN